MGTDDSGIDEMKERILVDLSPYLCRSLGDPSRYIPYLMARDINLLDATDKDMIKAEQTSQRKKEVFVEILKRKGACAFDGFVDVLLEVRDESHIARKLQQALKNEQENARSLHIQSGLQYIRDVVGDKFSEEDITDILDKCNMDGEAALCKLLENATTTSQPPPSEPQAPNGYRETDSSHSLLTPRTSYLPNITSKQQQLPPATPTTKPSSPVLTRPVERKLCKADIYTPTTTTSTTTQPPTLPSSTTRTTSTSDKTACPFAAPHWNTTILSRQFDHNGGTLTIEEHDITIVIPQLAISQGDTVEVQAAAAVLAPYLLPAGYDPVSVFVWVGGNYALKKMIKVIVPHCAAVGDDGTTQLTVLTATGSDSKLTVQQVDDNHQCRIGDLECHYYTDQLCSLCVARRRSFYPIRTRLSVLCCISKDYTTADQSTLELSLCCDLKYCLKRAKKYYKRSKSFEKPCLYQWLAVIDHNKQQKFRLSCPTNLTGWVINSLQSTKIDVKDMGFPQSISDVSALHKAQTSPFPSRFVVSLIRQSQYDDLAAELKICLENNGAVVTSNCLKLPVTIGKLKSRAKPTVKSSSTTQSTPPVVTPPSSNNNNITTDVTDESSVTPATVHSVVSSNACSTSLPSFTSRTSSTSRTSTAITTTKNVTATKPTAAVASADNNLVTDNTRKDTMGTVVDTVLDKITTSSAASTGPIHVNFMWVQGTQIAINSNPANQHNIENSRRSNSLQRYADDITTMVDVDTIVSPMMKYGLLTLDQQQQLTSLHVTTTKKQQTLCGIVLALGEVHVDKFLQCLSETSSYEPHNTLVKKIKYDMMRNTSHSDL